MSAWNPKANEIFLEALDRKGSESQRSFAVSGRKLLEESATKFVRTELDGSHRLLLVTTL